MESPSSEGSLVSIRICLVIGLRLRSRLTDWLAFVIRGNSSGSIGIQYTISPRFELGKVT